MAGWASRHMGMAWRQRGWTWQPGRGELGERTEGPHSRGCNDRNAALKCSASVPLAAVVCGPALSEAEGMAALRRDPATIVLLHPLPRVWPPVLAPNLFKMFKRATRGVSILNG